MVIYSGFTYQKWWFILDLPIKNVDLYWIYLFKIVIYSGFTYSKSWFIVDLPIQNGDFLLIQDGDFLLIYPKKMVMFYSFCWYVDHFGSRDAMTRRLQRLRGFRRWTWRSPWGSSSTSPLATESKPWGFLGDCWWWLYVNVTMLMLLCSCYI